MTAICRDAQTNLDFYTQVLGLRLTKITVNFDDPTAYHLYYGDRFSTPGTSLTFFPYQGHQAIPGPGQVSETHLAVPVESSQFWLSRIPGAAETATGIRFSDPDGLTFELRETDMPAPGEPWTKVVPIEYAIKGMSGVKIIDGSRDGKSSQVIQSILGYSDGLVSPSGRTSIELVRPEENTGRGHGGSGGVHHIAFRLPDDATQEEYHGKLYDLGFRVSPIMNRDYFHSIYFREPGGVLFELATDGPGMNIDEDDATLGTTLRLPDMYESHREQIEAALPKLRLPA